MRARWASAWIWAVRGAWPLAAAAAARGAAVTGVAGCPASSCACAWRQWAYPALCGRPRLSQAFAAHAAPLLAQEGMGDRVVHRAGDATTDDFGTAAFDLVFIANAVHHFDLPANRDLARLAPCAREASSSSSTSSGRARRRMPG